MFISNGYQTLQHIIEVCQAKIYYISSSLRNFTVFDSTLLILTVFDSTLLILTVFDSILLILTVFDSILQPGNDYTGCHKYVPFARFATERHDGV